VILQVLGVPKSADFPKIKAAYLKKVPISAVARAPAVCACAGGAGEHVSAWSAVRSVGRQSCVPGGRVAPQMRGRPEACACAGLPGRGSRETPVSVTEGLLTAAGGDVASRSERAHGGAGAPKV